MVLFYIMQDTAAVSDRYYNYNKKMSFYIVIVVITIIRNKMGKTRLL